MSHMLDVWSEKAGKKNLFRIERRMTKTKYTFRVTYEKVFAMSTFDPVSFSFFSEL